MDDSGGPNCAAMATWNTPFTGFWWFLKCDDTGYKRPFVCVKAAITEG